MRAARNGVSLTTNYVTVTVVKPNMSHIVNSCLLTKFDGGLLRLHEADEAAGRQLADNIWLLAYDNNSRRRESWSKAFIRVCLCVCSSTP